MERGAERLFPASSPDSTLLKRTGDLRSVLPGRPEGGGGGPFSVPYLAISPRFPDEPMASGVSIPARELVISD